MKLVNFVACAATIASTLGSAAFAHEETPYVCTPSGSPDGVAKFSSPTGKTGLVLQTAANGNSIVGCTLTNDNDTFKSVSFQMLGTGNDQNGPYVFVKGNYGDGTPVLAGVSITKARKVRQGSMYTYSFQASLFPFTGPVTTDVAAIQYFPGSTTAKVTVGNVRINAVPLKAILQADNGCPVGSSK